jgi:hypothetical protein
VLNRREREEPVEALSGTSPVLGQLIEVGKPRGARDVHERPAGRFTSDQA